MMRLPLQRVLGLDRIHGAAASGGVVLVAGPPIRVLILNMRVMRPHQAQEFFSQRNRMWHRESDMAVPESARGPSPDALVSATTERPLDHSAETGPRGRGLDLIRRRT